MMNFDFPVVDMTYVLSNILGTGFEKKVARNGFTQPFSCDNWILSRMGQSGREIMSCFDRLFK